MRSHHVWPSVTRGALTLALLAAPLLAHADDVDEDAPAQPSSTSPTTPARTPPPATPPPATPPAHTGPVHAAPAQPAPVAPASPAAAAPASSPAAPIAPPPPQEGAPAPRGQLAPEGPSFKLIGGAPLGDPNVNVHIEQRKELSDFGRHEVVLYPFVAQINGKFTNQVGFAAEYLYHFQENVAFTVTPMYNYISGESQFNEDLITIAQLQAQAATALTMQWGAVAGIEATPIYGKFAFYEHQMLHFAFVLDAGIGFASTHVQLSPGGGGTSATFGDTGYKFMGNVGAGFRVKFGEHWDVRLEVRDLVYSASVDSINGCNLTDLEQIEGQQAPTSTSCQQKSFATVTDSSGNATQPDVAIAKALIQKPSSDVLNQVEFFSGIAYIF